MPLPDFDTLSPVKDAPDFESLKPVEDKPPVVRQAAPGAVSPTNLVPAIRLMGGELALGEKGETHNDIIQREDLRSDQIDQRGFSDPEGKQFFDRESAATGTQLPTGFEPGRLHSTDLPAVKLDPYEQARMSGTMPVKVGATSGPENLDEVRNIGQILAIPAELAGKAAVKVGNIPTYIANYLNEGKAGYPLATLEELPRPQIPRVPGTDIPTGALNVGINLVNQMVPPFSSPETGLTLPLMGVGGKVGKVVAGAYGAAAAGAVPQATGDAVSTLLDPKATAAEKTEAVANPVVQTVLAGLMLKSAAAKPKAEFQGPLATGEALKTPEGAKPPPQTEIMVKGEGEPTPEPPAETVTEPVAEPDKPSPVVEEKAQPETVAPAASQVSSAETAPTAIGATKPAISQPTTEPATGQGGVETPPAKAEAGRDWELFAENLSDDLDSFAPARTTGKVNYNLRDVADRFVTYAKADKSGKPLDKLVSDFAKQDEASAGQIKKLRASVKSVLAGEQPTPPPAKPQEGAGEVGIIEGPAKTYSGRKTIEFSRNFEGRQAGADQVTVEISQRIKGGKTYDVEHTYYETPVGQKYPSLQRVKIASDLPLKDAKAAARKWLRGVRDVESGGKAITEPITAPETAPAPAPEGKAGEGVGREGPGALTAGTPPSGKAQIEELADSFRNISGSKLSLGERLRQAFQAGQRLSGAKDVLSKAVDGLKSSGNYLIGKWKQVQNIDDLLRAKGDLSAALETRGWRVREWDKLARKATPNPRDQAAIAKYVDAGGDMAELARGEVETKPQFKQAYRDAMNLKGDLKVAAENIRNYFDARLQEAIDAGVLEHGVEDYIHRIYESKPALAKKLWAYVQTGLLQKNPALTKKRIFQFDWEAEKLGYKPVQSYIPRIAQYESSLARAIAAREFIKKATTMKAADGRPVIDIKGVGIPVEDPATGVREATLIKPSFNPAKKNHPGTPNYRGDYVNKEFPALSRWKWVSADSAGKPIYVQGDVAIHPDYVNRVAALLEPSRVRYGRYGAVARPALNVGSAVKQTMLDLSGFHQVQVTVHGLEHRVNPFNLVQDIDFQNPNVDGLLRGGITLGGEYRGMAGEGLAGSALTRHIPILGPALESYHQWLFQDYIPRLKMTMALHALERNKARYAGRKTPEEIFHQTASEANAAFGEQNYIMLERSKTAQDMARLILLAPDFLEARGRFAGQALTRGGKAFGNEQRTALLLGALTMYVTARILNKATTGQYHNEPENLFSVVHNGKSYGLRTVQGDILHLLSKPLQFWMHRLNPVFGRTAMEFATGRDQFGRKRSFGEQMWDAVSTAYPISLRSSRERSLYESLANGFGVTARRWSDVDDAFKLARDWKEKHGVGERGEFIYDPDKDPLRGLKIALSNGEEGASTAELKKLLASGYDRGRLVNYFRRYFSMPFTGSFANDAKWKKTLTEDQLKTVQAAADHKQAVARLFVKALGNYDAALKGQ